jgi:hypothetical protein
MVMANTLPVWRDLVGSFINGYDYSLSFVGDAFKSIVDAEKHIAGRGEKQGGWDKYAFERSMTALGFWTGIPSDQITITGEGLYHWGEPGTEPWNVLVKPPAREYGPRQHASGWGRRRW